jgi:penicillin-binding protein 2
MFGFLPFGKKRKITLSSPEEIEPQEIFCDHLAQRQSKRGDQDCKKFEVAAPPRGLVLPAVFAALFFSAAFLRAGYLQIAEGDELLRQAQKNQYIFQKVQSDRGVIYDAGFNVLAKNLSAFDLQCDIQRFLNNPAERKRIIESLAAISGADAAAIDQAVGAQKTAVLENLDHRSLIILEARINDFPGCQVVARPIREYVRGAGLAHLLGYMSKINQDEWSANAENYSINDYIGRSGLEKFYETVLRKDPGKLRVERDANGNVIAQEMTALPESGDSIRLWLDYDLQKKLHDSMKKQLESLGLKKGTAIALDPKTGGVLAMVSFPDYDNNAFSQHNREEIQKLVDDKETNALLNRAVAGRYLTGSTIKPFIASAALQEGIIAADKNINCQGRISVQNQYDPEIVYHYNDNHIHGQTNMYKAIAESCNVYFYTIGGGYGDQKGLGPTRIKKYLDLFGWEEPTGIDLPGEIAGFVPDAAWKKEKFAGTQDQNWTDGNTYWLSIGQEFIGITPIEVASAYAAIANGGTLYRPQMVKAVVDSAKNTIEEKKPEIIRENFIGAAHLAAVREGMRFAVNGAGAPLASALTLNQLGIKMGTKTGTAQLYKGSDGKDLLNSWVNVFAPYDDPQIVLLVMAEEVREGTVAVLPVAKEVLGWYFEPKNKDGVRLSELPPANESETSGETGDMLDVEGTTINENPALSPAIIPDEEY